MIRRNEAVNAVVWIGPPAVPLLRDALGSENPYLRFAAAQSLEKWLRMAKRRSRRLEHLHDRRYRPDCGVGPLPKMPPDGVAALQRSFHDKDPDVRFQAALAMGDAGRSGKAGNPRTGGTASRPRCAGPLYGREPQLGGPRSRGHARRCLPSLKPWKTRIRRSVLVLLWHWDNCGRAQKPALQALERALSQDTDYHVRTAGSMTIASVTGEKAAIESLSKALRQDVDSLVRGSTAIALGNMGPGAKAAVAALEDALRDRSGEVSIRGGKHSFTGSPGDERRGRKG